MRWRNALFFLLFLGMISCSGLIGNYGLMNPSDGIRADFESFNINPEYRYYISGPDLYPNAILGLRKDLRLDPRTLWKNVAMTPAKMKEIVGNMKTRAFQYGLFFYGFEVTIPDGSPVGVWYSIPTARTLLRVNEDKTLWIETPDINIDEKFKIEHRED